MQLLADDVPRAVLEPDGDELEAVLAGFSPLHREGEVAGFPAAGWRIIRERTGSFGTWVSLASPQSDDPTRWYVIALTLESGKWILRPQAFGRSVRVRPGKAARRRGLTLDWTEDPARRLVGEPLDLRVVLRNRSTRTWTAGVAEDPEDPTDFPDSLNVVAWVFDEEGQRLPARTGFARSGWPDPLYLKPGESVEIAASLMTHDADQLSPGRYGLEAILTSVNLLSARGKLEVHAP